MSEIGAKKQLAEVLHPPGNPLAASREENYEFSDRRDTLLFGNPLRALRTKRLGKPIRGGEQNSGRLWPWERHSHVFRQ